jgi:hypothetical protein
MKRWAIQHGPRVKVFNVVRIYIVPPTMVSDDGEDQHTILSPHEARLANSAYEATLVVDVLERTFKHPLGYIPESERLAAAALAAAANAESGGKDGGSRGQKVLLPIGWEGWPLEAEELHLRKPFHRFGVMNMSIIDRRATGTLKPENFAYEDPHDHGGWFACANSAVFSPSHETLRHNHVFVFPAGSGSVANANDGSETPDLSEPYEQRHAKAQIGAMALMGKAHKLEIRCMHPTCRQRSTSTIPTPPDSTLHGPGLHGGRGHRDDEENRGPPLVPAGL